MQRARGKLPIYFIAVLVFSSCLVHFFQLSRFTDKNTGFVIGETSLPFVIYFLIFVTVGVIGFYAKYTDNTKIIDFSKPDKTLFLSSAFLSVTMFVDFIHQCGSVYNYISKTNYIEYVYIIPLMLSALLALVCCFYFSVLSVTAKGSNYDFRNFTLLHIAPVLWAFTRLILIMIKIIDIKRDADTSLEFLLLSFMLLFFFCYISMVDNGGKISKLFVFSAIAVFSVASIIVLPKMVLIVSGKWNMLYHTSYTGISYFAVGLFAALQIRK